MPSVMALIGRIRRTSSPATSTTPLSRRDAICTYRRNILDEVCRVYFPFLQSRVSRVDKFVHFLSAADSVLGHTHIAPVSVECASFDNSFGEFGRSPLSGDLHEFHEFGRSPLSGDLHVAQRARRARLCSFVAKPNFPYSPNGQLEVGIE